MASAKRPSPFPSPTPGRRSTPPAASPGSMEEEEEEEAPEWMRQARKRLREHAARQNYRYLSIADALKAKPGEKVCLFAAVYEIGAAVQSRGTDFTITLRIADSSRTTGISVTFFAASTARLPCVKSSGDFISLHDVEITKYREDFYVTFTKDSSSFALFESKVSAECSAYQTSIKYHGTKNDKDLLTRMRKWVPEKPLGLKHLELQLRNLKSDSTFDLVCWVLHVRRDNDKWIFYVWDGTDTPAAELQAISDAEAVESPLLLEEPPLPWEVLCTMPCVGTVLKIVSNKFVKEVAHMQNRIYWARFWNITCKQESGIWKGFFLDSSGVRLLSDEDGSVVDCRRMYDSRNANKVQRWPMAISPSNVADVDNKRARYSTLMESLTHKQVTHIVKTLVRVVAAYPCRASELPFLSTGDYCILLTLEDPTGRIHACVDKMELVKFFGGFPTKEVVIKKMKKLLGVPEPEDNEEVAPLTRSPPWIWCCLKSYYLKENDPWDSRRYQIFATTIRD